MDEYLVRLTLKLSKLTHPEVAVKSINIVKSSKKLNAIFTFLLITFKIFQPCCKQRYCLMEKNMTDILRTKAMLNFASSLIPKGSTKCTFYLSSFKSAHFDKK